MVQTQPERRRDKDGRASGRKRATHLTPLLIGAFIAAQAAAAAITLTTDEPEYELLLHGLVTLAVAFSLIGTLFRFRLSVVGTAVLVLSVAGYAIRFRRDLPVMVLAFPPEVLGDPELTLAVLSGWFLVGFCFMLSQRENAVFIFVTGLAVFGLMATTNLNIEFLVAFMVFLSATIYCWGYGHFADVLEATASEVDWPQWARKYLSGTTAIFVIAAVGGVLLGNGLYYATPGMYSGYHLGQRIWNYAGFYSRGYFTMRNGFELGRGRITLSNKRLFKIKAEQPYLWRGRSYDRYNGRGWQRESRTTRIVKRIDERSFALRKAGPRQQVRPQEDVSPPPDFDGAAARWGGSRMGPTPPGAPPSPGPSGTPPPGMMGGNMVGNAPAGAPQAPGAQSQGPDASEGGNRAPVLPPGAAVPSPQGGGYPGMPSGPGEPMPGPGRFSGRPLEEARQEADWELEPLQGRVVRQEVEVLSSDTNAVIAASFPYRLRVAPGPSGRDIVAGSTPLADRYGAVETRSIMSPGQTYTVWSRFPDFAPQQLRSAPDEEYDEDFLERYIDQTSMEVAMELGPLAEEITKDARTDYDKVAAIRQYLRKNFVYTLNVPVTPYDRDPVVYFVRETKRGACDLFASALVLMCRLVDVPARVATGFNVGKYDADEDAWIVRGLDAHAWAEVYFPEYGWVPFDVVAGRAADGYSWLTLLSFGPWRLAARKALTVLLWGLAVLGGLYLIATAMVDPREYVRAALRRWKARRQPINALALELQQLLKMVAHRTNTEYRPAMTPSELIRRASQDQLLRRNVRVSDDLRKLVSDFYALRYRKTEPQQRIHRLRQQVGDLRVAVRRAR